LIPAKGVQFKRFEKQKNPTTENDLKKTKTKITIRAMHLSIVVASSEFSAVGECEFRFNFSGSSR